MNKKQLIKSLEGIQNIIRTKTYTSGQVQNAIGTTVQLWMDTHDTNDEILKKLIDLEDTTHNIASLFFTIEMLLVDLQN